MSRTNPMGKTQFKIGDVVQLRSGGPAMVVDEVVPGEARVVWADSTGWPHERFYATGCLRMFDAEKSIREAVANMDVKPGQIQSMPSQPSVVELHAHAVHKYGLSREAAAAYVRHEGDGVAADTPDVVAPRPSQI